MVSASDFEGDYKGTIGVEGFLGVRAWSLGLGFRRLRVLGVLGFRVQVVLVLGCCI